MNGMDFALSLFLAVAARPGAKNVLVSPYSVRQAVGLAYIGADGKTRADIARALSAGTVREFESAEKKKRLSLASADPKVELHVADSLWLRDGVRFRTSYLDAAKMAFDAAAFIRPFDAATLTEINGWVSAATKGKIPTILENLTADDIGVIVNAVYFKGSWTKAFDKKATKPAEFNPVVGPPFLYPMMSKNDVRLDYYETAKFKAVRLPYGAGRLGMIVLLPAKDSSLAELYRDLDVAHWNKIRNGLKPSRGSVAIPRFKMEFSTDLRGPLTKLGMGIAFKRNRADFQSMIRAHGPVWISDVVHKTFISVDEAGTEAAAATAVIMMGHGLIESKSHFEFIADRPFLYAIEDSKDGTILFLGALDDPR